MRGSGRVAEVPRPSIFVYLHVLSYGVQESFNIGL